jgi:VWFA-related protein
VAKHSSSLLVRLIPIISFCFAPATFFSEGTSQQAPRKQTAADGTIRIDVDLVQTDVMVFDRQGRFVDNLTPDQFELRVDGKPQRIEFFDLITEGVPARKRAEVGMAAPFTAPERSPEPASKLGRTLLFFLDDWHLAADSLTRTRLALYNLIDNAMGPNDQAAIFAASGQLGFLQQLTGNKTVLKQALTRLRYASECVQDLGRPPMNEVQAVAIEQNDPEVFGFFVDQTVQVENLTDAPGARAMAEMIVRQRASSLAHISSSVTINSLAVLGSIVQSCAALPGRKLFFYLSDGFVLQPQRSDITYRLRLVAEAAARSGIVIYTLDTRGLVVGLPGASTPSPLAPLPVTTSFSASGEPAVAPTGESGGRLTGLNYVLANQDGLNALASDTGGRFLKNTNALDTAIMRSLEEASRYYLLGWYIDQKTVQPGRYSKMSVVLKGRPDLRLQARQNKMDLSRLIAKPPVRAQAFKPDPKEKSAVLKAIEFPWPIDALPTHVYAGYIHDAAKGNLVRIAIQADVEWPPATSGGAAGQPVEVMGIVVNRDGKTVFAERGNLSQPSDPASAPRSGTRPFTHNWIVPLEPGIYQVRVAAHDPNSGLAGSDHQWLDLPRIDLSQPVRKIQLGSVFVRARPGPDPTPGSAGDFFELAAAERRFTSDARLFFLAQVYNEAAYPIDVAVKVYLGNRIVAEHAMAVEKPAAAAADGAQIKGSLPLASFAPGAYVLELTAADRSTRASATRQVDFLVARK